MIVFTQAGDTPESVANRYAGYNDADLSQQIKQCNSNSFAWHIMNCSGEYAPNRALWISEQNDDIDAAMRDDIIHGFDWIPSWQRENLAKAQQQGVDLYDLLGVHALTAKANEFMSDENLGLVGAAFSYRLTDRITDLKLGRLEKFHQRLGSLKTTLSDLAHTSNTEQGRVLHRYHQQLTLLQEDFQHELKQFTLTNSPLLKRPLQINRKIAAHGWEIYDKFVMSDVERMAKMLKWSGRGFWAFELGDGLYETFDAYREGRDWTRVAVKEGLKTLAAYALPALTEGALFLLATTPVGWVGFIVVGAFEVGEIMTANHILDRKFN